MRENCSLFQHQKTFCNNIVEERIMQARGTPPSLGGGSEIGGPQLSAARAAERLQAANGSSLRPEHAAISLPPTTAFSNSSCVGIRGRSPCPRRIMFYTPPQN